MSKPIPKMQKYMTTTPFTIGQEQSIAKAQEIMKQHSIRHLPVLHAGKVVGLISERDIQLVETLKDVDPNTVLVGDAMSQDPYTVHPDASLDEVVETMAENKYGSAIVIDNDKVVGIFTTIDALITLSDLLHTRLKS